MRIFFTGGSGKAGHHVAPYLASHGHQVTNADLTPLGHPDVTDLRVDLTDAGAVYSALAGVPTQDEFDAPALAPHGGSAYDAVVHFAAIPRPLLASDQATYATNTMAHYNVLEAATALGIRKIVFASSETTYGVCFGRGERKPLYVPVDEEHPVVPEDSYAMSKVAGEVTAQSFHARTGADIYGLRINNVIEPHEYTELFPAFLDDPALRRRNLFAYIDTRDLGQLTLRCLQTHGLGFEMFNVANADMSVAATTSEIIDQFYDGVQVRRPMGRDETFYCIDKARRLLGYEPQHSWRDVIPDPTPDHAPAPPAPPQTTPSPTAALVTNALGMAIDSRRPGPGAVIHSDGGVQFGSWAFTDRARASGLVPSMGSIADCFDNAMIESFWSRMKVELLNRRRWRTRIELANAIFEYLEIWHNRRRRHSALGWLSPLEFENQSKIEVVQIPA